MFNHSDGHSDVSLLLPPIQVMEPTQVSLLSRHRESAADDLPSEGAAPQGLGRHSLEGVGDSGSEPRRASAMTAEDVSPDSKCAICLDRLNNVAYLDCCLHRFCFPCVKEWSNQKADCPVCRQPFATILHTVRTDDDYEEDTPHPAPSAEMYLRPDDIFDESMNLLLDIYRLIEDPGTSDFTAELPSLHALSSAPLQPTNQEGHPEEEECLIIGNRKPIDEPTPEIIEISSDSENEQPRPTAEVPPTIPPSTSAAFTEQPHRRCSHKRPWSAGTPLPEEDRQQSKRKRWESKSAFSLSPLGSAFSESQSPPTLTDVFWRRNSPYFSSFASSTSPYIHHSPVTLPLSPPLTPPIDSRGDVLRAEKSGGKRKYKSRHLDSNDWERRQMESKKRRSQTMQKSDEQPPPAAKGPPTIPPSTSAAFTEQPDRRCSHEHPWSAGTPLPEEDWQQSKRKRRRRESKSAFSFSPLGSTSSENKSLPTLTDVLWKRNSPYLSSFASSSSPYLHHSPMTLPLSPPLAPPIDSRGDVLRAEKPGQKRKLKIRHLDSNDQERR
ncbi:E3 ubiquitin-protein ligase Topors-like [Gouania willdenowi]|uniref:E3 ubiquitin-protein ligase Topors-like n=1 Tax=Gouania willdenowi TaxID=441366 RepID=UPI00105478CE|nr:E3 ubiquitin-protein ligase Topors-like [Gouania willdenowi]